tara:strand:- start:1705 stop:2232 length:528 start_codon:yes stop_codon:yes gene_type:complete
LENLNPTPQELNAFRKLMQNPEIVNMIEQFQDGTVNQYPTKKKTEKPKSQGTYKKKWLTPREVAELKGISHTWASRLVKEGFFGQTKDKQHRKGYVSRKVLREVVENTEMVGSGGFLKKWHEGQQDSKQEGKPQAEQEAFNYEDFKKQIMEDNGFLLALSREVMKNLKFVTKLDS